MKYLVIRVSSKKIQINQIPGTIISNIVCSLLTDIQGGSLLFITKKRPHWIARMKLSKWIDTISCQRKFNITRFFFENWPLFFNAPKCRPICKPSKNIILNSVLCMEIHKLCYTLTPEQLLETWNYRNITRNFARHLFCHFIGSIPTCLTLWEFIF